MFMDQDLWQADWDAQEEEILESQLYGSYEEPEEVPDVDCEEEIAANERAETFTIPTTAREVIEKAVAKFQKKAAAYGCQLAVTFGEPYAKERAIEAAECDCDGFTHNKVIGTEMIEVFDVTINSDLIRKDGYTVVAKLEHLDGGNVVSSFGEAGKPEWGTIQPRCQHCGGKHGQKVTFIVRHEDGTELQVGRTCLKDYCGIDPKHIAAINQLRDLFIDEDIDHHDFNKYPAPVAYSTIEMLAVSIHVMNEQGYVKSEEVKSNKGTISGLAAKHFQPSETELAKAQEMARKIAELDLDTAFSWNLDNIYHLINNCYCKSSHFGYIAYAPLAYQRYAEHMEREAKYEAEKAKEREASGHIGQVGQRMVIDIAEMKLLTSWDTQYGTTYLYKFIDTAGNTLVWFASKTMETASKIKATIKEHTERDGVKQTVITRCTAVAA